MKPAIVEIVPYKASWIDDFKILATVLQPGLQALASRIDHIGSTAVPGLAAKDRIDIQVTVLSSGQFGAVQEALHQLGYSEVADIRFDHISPNGPFDETEWEKRYFRPPSEQRPTNLHVRIEGKANQRYALLFRDYLREHPQAALAYGAVKSQIASYHKEDIEAYCQIKDPVCDIIMDSAYMWAKRVAWLPGPRDA